MLGLWNRSEDDGALGVWVRWDRRSADGTVGWWWGDFGEVGGGWWWCEGCWAAALAAGAGGGW